MTIIKNLSLMSLNLWGGKRYKEIINFLAQNLSLDIFCFQEVFSASHQDGDLKSDPDDCMDLYEKIEKILPKHQGFFCPIVDRSYGLAIFVKKSIHAIGYGQHWIYHNNQYNQEDPSHSRCLQWISLKKENQEFGIFNIHGLWNGKGKGDCPERLNQSREVVNFANRFEAPVIIVGDFNTMLDTESVKIIEADYQNLVRDYGIQSTRSELYTKHERYADYIFLPRKTRVQNFKVIGNNISDHLPLICHLKFDPQEKQMIHNVKYFIHLFLICCSYSVLAETIDSPQVCFLRHGHTSWSWEMLAGGPRDLPLNEEGIQNSQQAANILLANEEDIEV